ncbi:hypothetical protein MJO29_007834 [Puccinia striiformis f. sp. tritici]|nr:hypothetical protein MJO29_007834 [Puccinia striiformis f. sp. tritici]
MGRFHRRFCDAKIKKTNTSGYHPRTNGKNERYNGILEAALFRLNTTGDPAKWETFLPAALYSTRIHTSDSSKFSPFELTYGVKPRLPSDRFPLIAKKPLAPGEDELRERIKKINENRSTALGGVAERSLKNKAAFDSKLGKDVISYSLGQSVKLRNEEYAKGQARWFGPFEISKLLENNVYIISSPDGSEYSRPVNGNNLRPLSLHSLITNEMWAAPPAVALKIKQKDARIAKSAMESVKSLAKMKKGDVPT